MLANAKNNVNIRRYFTAFNYRQNSAISSLKRRGFMLFGVKTGNMRHVFERCMPKDFDNEKYYHYK